MGTKFPVIFRQILRQGVTSYQLKWEEDGAYREQFFTSEAEAAMEMDAIESRLRVAEKKMKPVPTMTAATVNPFGSKAPFINSKDVHFAALKLQPRGLKFREAIEDYVAATNTLQGMGISVRAAAASVVELSQALKPYEVSLHQAVFEWLEMKKQLGDVPLYEVMQAYLERMDPDAGEASDEAEDESSN